MGARPFGLDDLATSTRAAFRVLEPWYNKTYSSEALRQLTSRANEYVDALGYSIEAARYGFIVAQKGVTLIELLSKDGAAYSRDDRVAYVEEMVTIAQAGLQRARSVEGVFRGVRRKLMQLTQDALDEKTSDSTAAELQLLENGIEVLGKFEASVSMYIQWWISTILNAGFIRDEASSTDSSRLKRDAAKVAWMSLRESYVTYTDEISKVQDLHQCLLNKEKVVDERVSKLGKLSSKIANRFLGVSQ